MRARTVQKGRGVWRELIDYAVFFPGSLAESVLELDALCRRRERESGGSYPSVERLASRDERVESIACVASSAGVARFRVSYRNR